MAYRTDSDLNFLSNCTDEELKTLYDILVYDPKDGETWISETLSTSTEHTKYGSQYSKYWKRIAEELQLQGGNAIVNVFRFGDGVLYREIVGDVADNLKVSYYSNDSAEEIEDKIIEKIFKEILNSLSEAEKSNLIGEISPEQYKILLRQYGGEKNIPWGKIGVSLVRQMMKSGGFATYKLTVITANFVWKKMFGKGLTFAGNKMLTKALGNFLAGPLALVLNAWIIFDIASPATRITTPAVMIVAMLRKQVKYRKYLTVHINNNI